MRFLIDTNILIHAANRGSAKHGPALRFLQDHLRARTPWCTTWPILYDFLRVSTHRRVFPRPLRSREAVQFVTSLLVLDEVTILAWTERHMDVLKTVADQLDHPAGNIFHDIHTAALMREHGVGAIVTDDTDFLKFQFLRVINPLKSAMPPST